MSTIKDVKAREILDSRGNPTIEVDVILESGIIGTASVPSGASTGSREALELRDGDATRYMGKGVLKAVNNVLGPIKEKVVGMNSLDQRTLDYAMIELDGTENKTVLGANAILGVSMANVIAASKYLGIEVYEYMGTGTLMPQPMMNIVNGGMHADNNLDIQEFMILPKRDSIRETVRVGSEIFHTLKGVLKDRGNSTGVGDEGGFAPNLNSTREAFDLIIEATKKAGYTPGVDVTLAIDAAANSFYKDGMYYIDGLELTSEGIVDYYVDLVANYPIESIEDPVDENDDGLERYCKI